MTRLTARAFCLSIVVYAGVGAATKNVMSVSNNLAHLRVDDRTIPYTPVADL
jgi:hypothetical protein